MTNIAVFAVLYLNHADLDGFVGSLRDSACQYIHEGCKTDLSINVHLLDNSQNISEDACSTLSAVKALQSEKFTINYISMPSNLGYLGPLGFAQKLASSCIKPDIVIYCNCDLLFDLSFISALMAASLKQSLRHVTLVAPSIIAMDSYYDKNPMYIRKPSRSKLKLLRAIYSNYISAFTYELFAKLRNISVGNLRSNTRHVSQVPPFPIYAAHGACFIFLSTSDFLSLPTYPIFLFGEELFIAHYLESLQLSTLYLPSLILRDRSHSSLHFIGQKRVFRYMYESLDYLIKSSA